MTVDTLNAISVFPIKLKQMLPVISLSPAGLSGGPWERLFVLGASRLRYPPGSWADGEAVRTHFSRQAVWDKRRFATACVPVSGSAVPGCGRRLASPAFSEEKDVLFLKLLVMRWENWTKKKKKKKFPQGSKSWNAMKTKSFTNFQLH